MKVLIFSILILFGIKTLGQEVVEMHYEYGGDSTWFPTVDGKHSCLVETADSLKVHGHSEENIIFEPQTGECSGSEKLILFPKEILRGNIPPQFSRKEESADSILGQGETTYSILGQGEPIYVFSYEGVSTWFPTIDGKHSCLVETADMLKVYGHSEENIIFEPQTGECSGSEKLILFPKEILRGNIPPQFLDEEDLADYI